MSIVDSSIADSSIKEVKSPLRRTFNAF